ncbi:MAG: PD40 domain-containing protein [Methylococcaceae bacterium]|nr:PD40 domain-containing protein [Methylococcaceae bacterium]
MLFKFIRHWVLTGLYCLTVLFSSSSFAGYPLQLSLIPDSGQGGNGNSISPSLSADGRIVAFESAASDLVTGDSNNSSDIFVKDFWNGGKISRVSVSSTGQEANGYSSRSQLSANGRFVVFTSGATNLVPNDTNGLPDIFVHDIQLHTTIRVNVDSNGNQAVNPPPNPPYSSYGGSDHPKISADGRIVAFESYASNLTSDDQNKYRDIFVHDLLNHQTNRVKFPTEPSRNCLDLGNLSADGRFIAFTACDKGIVPNDTNYILDVFVFDRVTKTFKIASVDSAGAVSPAPIGTSRSAGSFAPSLSADGRLMAFCSWENYTGTTLNRSPNVYLHNFVTKQTALVNPDLNYYSCDPEISANGYFVAYRSVDTLGAAEDFFVTNWRTKTTRKAVLPPYLISLNSACPWCKISSFRLNADGTVRTFASDWVVGVNGGVFPIGIQDIFWRDSISVNTVPEDFAITVTQQPLNVKPNTEANFIFSVTNLGINPAPLRLYHLTSGGIVSKFLPSQGCQRFSLISICNLGVVFPGASQTVQFSLKASKISALIQQVSLHSYATADINLSNNRVLVKTPVLP